MNALAIVLIICCISCAAAFQAGLKTRVNVNSKLQMALADYKEELAATAAAIASPGKLLRAMTWNNIENTFRVSKIASALYGGEFHVY